MQFQIECNNLFLNQQICLTCNNQFLLKEARVIICDEQGKSYGDICSDCISKGSTWIKNRFQQLNPKLSSIANKNKHQVASKALTKQIA